MIKATIRQRLSESTLLSFVLRLHMASEKWETNAKEQIILAPSLYVDEKSMKVNGKNHWIDVYASGDIRLKLLHPKRGNEAIKENDIIPRYGGVFIHACWASYLTYDHCLQGLCGSHLLRELTFIIDANDYLWAKHLKKMLQ